MNLYLVRHGETDWNREGRAQGRADLALNDQGLAQCKALCSYFEDAPLTAIYSSVATRARQTAEEIAVLHSLSVQAEEGLLELDFGALDGVRLREMRERFPEFFQNWTTAPESAQFPDGGETLAELQARTWGTIQAIAQRHDSSDSVVVVSHAFAIYSILCQALGMPLANYGRLRLSPGTVSLLTLSDTLGPNPIDARWTLAMLNHAPLPSVDA